MQINMNQIRVFISVLHCSSFVLHNCYHFDPNLHQITDSIVLWDQQLVSEPKRDPIESFIEDLLLLLKICEEFLKVEERVLE